MRDIWHRIKAIFVKKHKEETVKKLKEDKLTYTGDEPACWACQEPIHESQRSRRLNGNKIHVICFKRLKKIMMRGESLHGF